MPKVLVPDSMTRFRCNLQGCCCKGWRIHFSTDDIIRLTSAFPAEERKEIVRDMRVWVARDNVLEGLQLRTVGPEQACQFLAGDGRCGAQLRFGESVLPLLCRTFPGFSYDSGDGRVEVQFDPVCPSVLTALDESDAPLELIEVEPPRGDHIEVRARQPTPPPQITIGDRALSLEEFHRVRQIIVSAIGASDAPALDVLCRVSHALARLGGGEPVDAFTVRASEPGEAFDAFFEACVSAHEGVPLGLVLQRYDKFIFDVALDHAALAPHLRYDPAWRSRIDPRAPALQPLLRRYLAHCFFNAYHRSRVSYELMFSYGQNAHTLATAFRYAVAFAKHLDRDVDRVVMRTALGASEYWSRYTKIPITAMPWFGLTPRETDDGGSGVDASPEAG